VCEAEVVKEADLPEQDKKPRAKRPNHPGRFELPAHLPRKEELVLIKGEERLCSCCGKERCLIGYEVKEELGIIPMQLFVRVIKREKLACPDHSEGGVAVAPISEERIVEKGKLGNDMLIDVVVKKYDQHQPLYRQEATLQKDFDVQISRKTLCDGALKVGELLIPVKDELLSQLICGKLIQADETPVGVQNTGKKGSNHQAYLWEYSSPGGPVVFDFQLSRKREGPAKVLEKFSGILQTDGYSGYDSVGMERMKRGACMAHARRKFMDALKVDPGNSKAREIITIIGKLYAVEAKARENKFSHAQRLELRQAESISIFATLKQRIIEIRMEVLPGCQLAKACNYTLNLWERLVLVLEYGELEIDNNLCENSIRPIALGRKNWMHIGSPEAGKKIAAILSVLETCRRLKINVRKYLAWALPKLAKGDQSAENLTPMAWQAIGDFSANL
jgi:transposase